MARSALTALFAILDKERHALLNARYDALPDLAEKKEQSLQDLALSPPPEKVLQMLKTQIRENQDLTAAALRGVDAARKRIAALEDVRDTLTTYDPSGKLSLMPNHQKTVEKKA